jgi:hypothetical protein
MISNKIKLFSCKTAHVESLKHYWILHRPENMGQFTLGEILPPADIGEETEKFNINELRKQLNDGNCFDSDLLHQEKDILALHFTCNPASNKSEPTSYSGNYLIYAFAFKNGKWRKTSYDHFLNNLSEIQAGKILKPFVNEITL